MRLFVYPYTYRNEFLMFPLSHTYDICGVFIQKGWKFNRGLLQKKGIKIYETWKLEDFLEECDGVLFYPNEIVNITKLREKILGYMSLCMEKQKNVYCAMNLENAEIKKYNELSQKTRTQFVYFPGETARYEYGWIERLEICDIPIVYIGELCEGAGAKELTVKLSLQMQERGYRVCTVLDDPCASFLGMEATPPFIRQAMKEAEKVTWLNRFVKDLEREQQPDIFFMQIPGSVSRYSEKILSDFGIYHFYYSNALCPDMFFCAMPYNICNDRIAELIDKSVRLNYCYSLDGVYRTNLQMDALAACENGYVDYMYLTQQEENGVREGLSCGISVFCGWEEDGSRQICDIIERTLSEETIEIL